MPDVLSAEPQIDTGALPQPRALDLPARFRLGMVILGFIPLFHLAASLVPATLALTGWASLRVAWLSPLVLFLAPPFVVRLASAWKPLNTGLVDPASATFLYWWFTAQWQVLFARLPALEEMMRMIPGLYSLWLRLWGARVGALVYWSPGVVILDRGLVRIGSRVIIGAAARLNPHALAPVAPDYTRSGFEAPGAPQARPPERSGAWGPSEGPPSPRLRRGLAVAPRAEAERRGRAAGAKPPGSVMKLYLGPITIGDDALIGASSQLLPGCEIAAGEVTPPFRTIHAFSRFAGGRRSS